MKKLPNSKLVILNVCMLYLIFPQIIFAYLDPGTGSYMLQIILAAVVGLAYTIKIYWVRVKAFIVNLFSKKS